MADVLMGVTETNATALEVISNVVQSFLIQESKLIPTVSDFSSLAIKGAKSVAIPRSNGFVVYDKEENVSVNAQALTYSADVLELNKHKVIQFLLEDIAEAQSVVAVVEDTLMKATKAMALQIDKDIIAQLKLASASSPDHKINYIDTTGNVLALGDILMARKLLADQNIDPKECFIGIGPSKEKEMLNIQNFIDASKYGSNEPVINGEIGKVFGIKVILHTGFEEDLIAWHPSAVAFAIQQDMRYQTQLDLANLSKRHSLDVIYGVKVLDGGKRNVLVEKTV